jgi:hypothetical protein
MVRQGGESFDFFFWRPWYKGPVRDDDAHGLFDLIAKAFRVHQRYNHGDPNYVFTFNMIFVCLFT